MSDLDVILAEIRQFRVETNDRFGEVHDRFEQLQTELTAHRKTGNGNRIESKTGTILTITGVATGIATGIAAAIKALFFGGLK